MSIIYVCALVLLAVACGVAASTIWSLKERVRILNSNVATLSTRCSRLGEAVRLSANAQLAERLDDLGAAVDHQTKIHQRFAGRVWQRLGRDHDKDEDEAAPNGEDAAARRDALRSQLLPKTLTGKIAAMTRGAGDD